MFDVLDANYWKSLAALPDGFERISKAFVAIITDRDEARQIAAASARGHLAQIEAARSFKARADELLAANNDVLNRYREAKAHVEALTKALGKAEGNDAEALYAYALALTYLGWFGPNGPEIPGEPKEKKHG